MSVHRHTHVCSHTHTVMSHVQTCFLFVGFFSLWFYTLSVCMCLWVCSWGPVCICSLFVYMQHVHKNVWAYHIISACVPVHPWCQKVTTCVCVSKRRCWFPQLRSNSVVTQSPCECCSFSALFSLWSVCECIYVCVWVCVWETFTLSDPLVSVYCVSTKRLTGASPPHNTHVHAHAHTHINKWDTL